MITNYKARETVFLFYDSELQFLKKTFEKLHIRFCVINRNSDSDLWEEMGLVHLAEADSRFVPSLSEQFASAQNNIIYKATDPFSAGLIFLLLPEASANLILVVGPYLSKQYTRQSLLEQAEKLNMPPSLLSQAEEYYGNLPLVTETSSIFAILDTFAEFIWKGDGNFSVSDITQESFVSPLKMKDESSAESPETAMRIMEERYNYENKLISAVSKGLTHKADLLFSGLSLNSFERRLSDPLRNIKNYGIIMNTLCRKAAESGGVHPVYLDSISSDFARKIEQLPEPSHMYQLMPEMFRSYCRLVRKHSMKNYSPPVQKAIVCIDSDLSSDLSLKKLAQMQNLSPSYLSTLFSRETGQTITEHVNQKRIALARHLLSTTSLQVQTIAQHCGFPDVQYFSKIYKKLTGETPKHSRKNHSANF